MKRQSTESILFLFVLVLAVGAAHAATTCLDANLESLQNGSGVGLSVDPALRWATCPAGSTACSCPPWWYWVPVQPGQAQICAQIFGDSRPDPNQIASNLWVQHGNGLAGSAQGLRVSDRDLIRFDGGVPKAYRESVFLSFRPDPACSALPSDAPYWISYNLRIDPSLSDEQNHLLGVVAYDTVPSSNPIVNTSVGRYGSYLRYKINCTNCTANGQTASADLARAEAGDDFRVLILVDPGLRKHTHWVWKNGRAIENPILGVAYDWASSRPAPYTARFAKLDVQTLWSIDAASQVDLVIDEVKVVDVPPPGSFKAVPKVVGGADAIDLSWTWDSAAPTRFLIDRSEDGRQWARIRISSPNEREYRDSAGLQAKRKYHYRIAAEYEGTSTVSPWAMTWAVAAYRAGKPLTDWLDVQADCGARGDGITDDTGAIQTCINRMPEIWGASTPMVLYFPDGVYRITSTVTFGPHRLWYQFVGQSPGGVIVQWDGGSGTATEPLPIFRDRGNSYGTFRNFVWDGGGSTKFTVAFDEATPYAGGSDGWSAHYDSVFRNAYIGLRIGHDKWQNSELTVRRCTFLNNDAGVSIEDDNAMDLWFWDCWFEGNRKGVANDFGAPFDPDGSGPATTESAAGDFVMYRGRFKNNAEADMSISNTGRFTARDCSSIGSKRFFYGAMSSAAAQITLQNNSIRIGNFPDPVGRYAIVVKNAGPLLLIDNRIDTTVGGTRYVPLLLGSYVTTNVVALNNRYTYAGSRYYDENSDVPASYERVRIDAYNEQHVESLDVQNPVLPSPSDPLEQQRPVYTATDGASLPDVIAEALAAGEPAIVHLPSGTFHIAETLQIPENAKLLVLGNGNTRISWGGAAGQDMIRINGAGVDDLTLRDLRIDGTNQDLSSTGIRVFDANQDSAAVTLNRVTVEPDGPPRVSTGLEVDRCDRVSLDVFDTGFGGGYAPGTPQACWDASSGTVTGMRFIGGPQAQTTKAFWSGGSSGAAWDTEVVDGPAGFNLLLANHYMERSAHSTWIHGAGGPVDVAITNGRMASWCLPPPMSQANTDLVLLEEFGGGNVAIVGQQIWNVTDSNPGAPKAILRSRVPAQSGLAVQIIGNGIDRDPDPGNELAGADTDKIQNRRIIDVPITETLSDAPPIFDPLALERGFRLLRTRRLPGFPDEELAAGARRHVHFDNLNLTRLSRGIVLEGGIPASPNGLQAVATGANRIDLVWTYGSGELDGFAVERSESGGGFAVIATPLLDVITFVDSTVLDGTRYSYRVAAYRNGTGSSGYTNVASALTPLRAPTNARASASGTSSIVLTWTDNSAAEAGYKIHRSATPTFASFVTFTKGPGVTSFTDPNLTEGTTWYYRIYAFTEGVDAQTSPYSTIVSATTQLEGPTGLQATSGGTSSISLTWTDNSTRETAYELDRSLTVDFAQPTTLGLSANISSYLDTNLTDGTTYFYRVRCTNPTAGPSANSNAASATTQIKPPSGLVAGAGSLPGIRLTWADQSASETTYLIERSTQAATGFTQIQSAPENATSCQDGGPAPDTLYYYRVRCRNAAAGYSSYSNVTSSSVPKLASKPNPGDNKTSVAVTATLSWTAGSGATSHDVYFGASQADVTQATRLDPRNVFKGNQTAKVYDPPGNMAPGIVYYWRIDEVKAGGIAKGTVWKFTTKGTALGALAPFGDGREF